MQIKINNKKIKLTDDEFVIWNKVDVNDLIASAKVINPDSLPESHIPSFSRTLLLKIKKTL